MKRSESGLTLLEIFLVIIVVSILLTLVLSNLLGARISVNESSAVHSLATIIKAQENHRSGNPSYAGSLGSLSGVDEGLASGSKKGYNFTMGAAGVSTWSVTATPIDSGETGNRVFYADQRQVIRLNGPTGDPINQ